MALTPAPVRDPFDKDLRASRSWVAWFASVQETLDAVIAGSVTSVGLALPAQFSVSGSPITGAGTLTGAWKAQPATLFLGGPVSGPSAAPDFRALTAADIPSLAYDPSGAAAAVQTNLNTHAGLTGTSVHGLGDWSVKNYPTWTSGTPFLKMTAAGTFGLDTSTYLTSLTGAVLTDQTVGQTIGATGTRLTKLWATDITTTNAIAGSVTGNAGTVTNGLYTTGLGSVTQAYSAKLAGLAGLTDAAGWYHSNGSGTYAWSTPTKSDVGLSSVENTALSTWAGTTNLTTLGTLTTALAVNSVGPHVIGSASPVTSYALLLTGAFTSASDTAYGFRIDPTLSVSAGGGQSAILFVRGTLVEYGSGNHGILAGTYLAAPTITPGAATVTNGATLYIAGAPTGTVSGGNYAEYINAGNVRWGGYGAGAATFDASGNITSVSDARCKDRIAPLPYGLDEVVLLSPVQHGYNRLSGLEREHLYGGFLAQDVQAVMPLAVGTNPDGYLTLSDRPILGAIVNAIKELHTRLTALE